MLAKRTVKNQLTLPKAIVSQMGDAEYFTVTVENGSIILTPIRARQVDAVRAELAKLGVNESDVADAVAWARRK
jgi:antitoxin component of MazEF toxin-antitoxin module